jgi:hypothetical protein
MNAATAEIMAVPRAEYRATSLDALWAEAETLGKVSISTSYPTKYRATIQFQCRHGTVFAEGRHDCAAVALGIAINHAREFGTGVAP